MKVSLNWAQYVSNVDLGKLSLDELKQKIGLQLGAVEEVIEYGPRYKQAIIAEVASCRKHPDADRLNVCLIDDGGVAQNVARTPEGLVQVVCGAPNIRENLTVVWLPPGSTVPSTIDTDPFVLGTRELRGVSSNGMIASSHELGFSNDHTGILELDLSQLIAGTKIGDSLTQALALENEAVIDCENKMFTHRPDCFGILGVARELAGIQHESFKSPEWYLNDPQFNAANELPIEVRNMAGDLVPRFTALTMKNVTVTPSPDLIQFELKRVGINSVNNVVDIVNYIMHLTGQPLHAYDYDKVKALSSGHPVLIARNSVKGEKINLLNGKTAEMIDDSTIVIATETTLLGIAGVMGGSDTEVDETTKNIILECATFDMYNIRRTSMKYGLFTDAVTRYTKGQSPLQNRRVIAKAAADISSQTGAIIASSIEDIHQNLKPLAVVNVGADFINTRLGSNLSAQQMADLLMNVEISTTIEGDVLNVTAPFWRTDIELPEDIVEEVGRLYGYDNLPITLPKRTIKPVSKNPYFKLNAKLRNCLSSAGANEILSYSFVSNSLIEITNQDKSNAFQIGNALSPELQYYRLSLTPSLLEKVNSNIRTNNYQFALYEINKVHSKQLIDEQKLPIELPHLGFVFAAENKTAKERYSGAPYFQALKYLDYVLAELGDSQLVRLVPLGSFKLSESKKYQSQLIAPYELSRSAAIVGADDNFWGVIGEFKSSVRRSLKLPEFCAGFELNTDLFIKHSQPNTYHALQRFPGISQDLTIQVSEKMSFDKFTSLVQQAIHNLSQKHGYVSALHPVDIFQKADSESKSITLRIVTHHLARTLTTSEINNYIEEISEDVRSKIQSTYVKTSQ